MTQENVHAALFKCPAYFLGRRAPADCTIFMEAIQKPLVEMYTEGSNTGRDVDMPREGHLLVLSSGIMFVSVNPLDKSIWLRMEDFRSGSALKAIAESGTMRFYELDSPQVSASYLSPVYALITTRNKGVILNDCYGFSLANNDNARYVQSAVDYAANDKSCWSGTTIPPKINHANLELLSFKEEASFQEDEGPIDRFKKPDLGNFFYAPSASIIKCYSVKEDAPERLLSFPEVKQKSLSDFLSTTTPAPTSTAPATMPPIKNEFILMDETTGQPIIIDDPERFNYAAYGIDANDPSIQLVASYDDEIAPREAPLSDPAYAFQPAQPVAPLSNPAYAFQPAQPVAPLAAPQRAVPQTLASDFLLFDGVSGKPLVVDDPRSFDYAAYGIDPNDPTIQIIPAGQFREEVQGAY